MKRLPGLVVAVLVMAPAVLALDRPGAPEPPPQRIVRVSSVDGDASYQRGDSDDWSSLGTNTPLMTGDSVYTPNDARAEVSLGRGGFVRLGDDTQIDLVNMTAEVTQIGMGSGRVSLRVREIPEGSEFEMDSPYSTATLREPGLYRFMVTDRDATYEVVSGGLSVVLNGEQLDVRPGESLNIGGSEPPTFEYGRARPTAKLDDWAASRDDRYDRSGSGRYVHPQVEGQEDLDAYGTWMPHPNYGRVWVPTSMGPDWAPYQNGRWIWQDPYGWTWVSYESWGWAPYHYGRWVHYGGSWGWVPPPPAGVSVSVAMPAPVYAPALVAFIGGSNWRIGVSVGGGSAIGWVPLAPAERYYYPWQPAPVHRTTVYQNVTVNNSVTVVQNNTFINGGGERIRCTHDEIRRAPRMGNMPSGIEPTQASLAPYPRRKEHPAPPVPVRMGQRRTYVARLVPPPKPMSFKDKSEKIRKTGRPVEQPIAMDGDVGKPYRKGARVPRGVDARSALSQEKPARIAPRNGGSDRAPRRIDQDLLPVQGSPAGSPVNMPGGQGGGWQKGAKNDKHDGAGEPAAASVTGEPVGVDQGSTAPIPPSSGPPGHSKAGHAKSGPKGMGAGNVSAPPASDTGGTSSSNVDPDQPARADSPPAAQAPGHSKAFHPKQPRGRGTAAQAPPGQTQTGSATAQQSPSNDSQQAAPNPLKGPGMMGTRNPAPASDAGESAPPAKTSPPPSSNRGPQHKAQAPSPSTRTQPPATSSGTGSSRPHQATAAAGDVRSGAESSSNVGSRPSSSTPPGRQPARPSSSNAPKGQQTGVRPPANAPAPPKASTPPASNSASRPPGSPPAGTSTESPRPANAQAGSGATGQPAAPSGATSKPAQAPDPKNPKAKKPDPKAKKKEPIVEKQ
jgi:hypothetical protein